MKGRFFIRTVLLLSLAGSAYVCSRPPRPRSTITQNIDEAQVRLEGPEFEVSRGRVQNPGARDALELARLRNEVAQLRRQGEEAGSKIAELRKELGEALQNLARAEKELAESTKRSPEEWQRMVFDRQSDICANHLKQILVGLWIWAGDHNDVFPPDLMSLQTDTSPEIFVCPADTTTVRATDGSRLSAASISYRFMDPNGSHSYSTNVVLVCPIHGHYVLGNGSVHRQ